MYDDLVANGIEARLNGMSSVPKKKAGKSYDYRKTLQMAAGRILAQATLSPTRRTTF